jgi:coenzyme F420-0:L-glutamate ligase/coenzyme F420-1:gamma-L-glutamate ligase
VRERRSRCFNVEEGTALLLPEDPDASARQYRGPLKLWCATRCYRSTRSVAWREGLVNVAIGVAGLAPLIDYRGQTDSHGRPLRVTVIAVADEIASAAELVMKKKDRVPVAIIRGFDYTAREASGRELIRAPELDLFR